MEACGLEMLSSCVCIHWMSHFNDVLVFQHDKLAIVQMY